MDGWQEGANWAVMISFSFVFGICWFDSMRVFFGFDFFFFLFLFLSSSAAAYLCTACTFGPLLISTWTIVFICRFIAIMTTY